MKGIQRRSSKFATGGRGVCGGGGNCVFKQGVKQSSFSFINSQLEFT